MMIRHKRVQEGNMYLLEITGGLLQQLEELLILLALHLGVLLHLPNKTRSGSPDDA